MLNRLALHWGVFPLPSAWVETREALHRQAQESLLHNQLAQRGDAIAITYGLSGDGGLARTNTLELRRVEPAASA